MIEQVVTSKEGSFARFTILNRFPEILRDLISGNSFSPSVEQALNELLKSIPAGRLSPLSEGYPFAAEINQALNEKPGYGWLNAPFLFIENYLYHRISDLCGYFTNSYDYFFYRKEAESLKGLEKFTASLQNIDSISSFSGICMINLMGNKADLSQSSSYYSSGSTSSLLIDHRAKAASKINEGSRVDIILDNAGEELFFDLLLAYWLFNHTAVQKVKLHFKQMPYFVSDALISDYRSLLNILSEKQDAAGFVRSMNNLEDEGKLELGSHPFFVSGRPFATMPEELSSVLSQSDLIIFKGDLNYRRLIEDRYWPYETQTSSILNYLPADILISRILKSEVMVGLEPGESRIGKRPTGCTAGSMVRLSLLKFDFSAMSQLL